MEENILRIWKLLLSGDKCNIELAKSLSNAIDYDLENSQIILAYKEHLSLFDEFIGLGSYNESISIIDNFSTHAHLFYIKVLKLNSENSEYFISSFEDFYYFMLFCLCYKHLFDGTTPNAIELYGFGVTKNLIDINPLFDLFVSFMPLIGDYTAVRTLYDPKEISQSNIIFKFKTN